MKKSLLLAGLSASLLFSMNVFAGDKNHKNHNKNFHEKEIRGIIRSVPDSFTGVWNVEGNLFEVNDSTKLENDRSMYKKGQYVEVEVQKIDKKLVAQEIEIEDSIKGIIKNKPTTSISGTWLIGNQKVEVNSATVFKDDQSMYKNGRYVEVEIENTGDKLVAKEFEIK